MINTDENKHYNKELWYKEKFPHANCGKCLNCGEECVWDTKKNAYFCEKCKIYWLP